MQQTVGTMKNTNGPSSQTGMTLVEVIVACAVFTVASLATAHLLVWAMRTLWFTGAETIALVAAQGKLEELHSLAWRFDEAGNRISDLDTHLAGRQASGGGPGLAPSPSNTLHENVDGYVDYLDTNGEWAGSGSRPPPEAAFVRRWAVRPLASAPDDTLVLEVLVVPIGAGRSSVRTTGQGAGESWLISARTRVR